MAYTPTVFHKWRYTDDRGNHLVYKILEHITTQMSVVNALVPKIGGTEADGTELRPPASFRPRVVLLWNATNKLARRVVAFDATAPLYDGTEVAPNNVINLYAGRPSELLSFTCYGYEGERLRGERPTA